MKILTGVVTSTKMTDTVSVKVSSSWTHPVYKKAVKRSKKYLADNPVGAREGDTVIIREGKPVSLR